MQPVAVQCELCDLQQGTAAAGEVLQLVVCQQQLLHVEKQTQCRQG